MGHQSPGGYSSAETVLGSIEEYCASPILVTYDQHDSEGKKEEDGDEMLEGELFESSEDEEDAQIEEIWASLLADEEKSSHLRRKKMSLRFADPPEPMKW